MSRKASTAGDCGGLPITSAACTFAMHENVYPGPNKKRYVIKRLLRRAVLDGRQIGKREPFLHQLVPVVAEMMKNSYPELAETTQRVSQGIKAEEENFLATIDAGLERVERLFEQMHKDGRGVVAGEDAFEMYQTHGFPPELFENMAAERNLLFDWESYRRSMEATKRNPARKSRAKSSPQGPCRPWSKSWALTRFVGYESTEAADATVVGIIAANDLVDKVQEVDHEPITLVLDKTPFYGEMGGQVGDQGEIVGPGFRFEVIDSQIDSGLVLHKGHLQNGELRLHATVTARVDRARRRGIRRAHTATHLLHHALQNVLGGHAQQQGSKVDRDWLRFDFSNPSSVSAEQLARIEDLVNEKIMEGAAVTWTTVPIAEARKAGATMLFGEKYPDIVRVVAIGDYSKELCGGTHLASAGETGLFKIIGEESVAAGTRRITALSGPAALEHVHRNETALARAAAVLKIRGEELPERVEALVKEIRDLKKRLAAGPRIEGGTPDQLLSQAVEVQGTKVLVLEVPDAGLQGLRDLIDQLRRKASPIAVMLASRTEDGKVSLVAGLSRDLTEKKLDAVQWIRSVAGFIGGGGGGRPDLAQAGGKEAGKLAEALAAAKEKITELLGG